MRRLAGALGVLISLSLGQPALSDTFTVTDTLDSGVGTLRWAIGQVNGSPGPHRIAFNIPGVGVRTIHLLSDPDPISHTVAIDGRTEPGYNTAPLIEIDGTGSATGLAIQASAPHSSMAGLVLNRFQTTALTIAANACSLYACYVGLTADGAAAAPNGQDGVSVTGNQVLVGGHLSLYRNVISGNNYGVELVGPAFQDSVIGNFIGTDVTGRSGVGNGFGVWVNDARAAVIDGNVISGNEDGINGAASAPTTEAEGLKIFRNLIGTDASGFAGIPNNNNGIDLTIYSHCAIGGIGKGNVISGNGREGLSIKSGDEEEIYGNKIGVTSDGTRLLGNGDGGIDLASTGSRIGHRSDDGSGNLIGGGSSGLYIHGLGNVIEGNAIGTSFNGALSLGSLADGVELFGDSTVFGGPGGMGNIVAHNGIGGVTVYDGHQLSIRGNAIFDNGSGLGIDLILSSGNPVEPNDSLDADDGPNGLQNYPVITATSKVGNQVRLQGRLPSQPLAAYALDFYASTGCNTWGYGEGEFWLGSVPVTTNASGLATFDVSYPLSGMPGYVFTATATDSLGNTSEFSPCASIVEPTAAQAPTYAFALGSAYPDPARTRTEISFTLACASRVVLCLYDVSGRKVATLENGDLPAGPHVETWSTSGLAPSVYFCRLRAEAKDGPAETFSATRPVVVIR